MVQAIFKNFVYKPLEDFFYPPISDKKQRVKQCQVELQAIRANDLNNPSPPSKPLPTLSYKRVGYVSTGVTFLGGVLLSRNSRHVQRFGVCLAVTGIGSWFWFFCMKEVDDTSPPFFKSFLSLSCEQMKNVSTGVTFLGVILISQNGPIQRLGVGCIAVGGGSSIWLIYKNLMG